MCEDLENKAQDHAMWVLCDITDDNLTLDSVRQMLAEAYKQGYRDSKSLVCYNKRCSQRLLAEEEDEVSDFEAAITAEKNRVLKRFGME